MPNMIGLVLPGGGARGAYEAGVVDHLVREVAKDLGRDLSLDLLCGTSIGALNATFLAAHADAPAARGQRLVAAWSGLEPERLLRPDPLYLLAWLCGGLLERRGLKCAGGLLDARGAMRLVRDLIPFSRIGDNLRAGRVRAVTVSATHVGTGRTTVFVQGDAQPAWPDDTTMVAQPAVLRSAHVLASAAIPVLFPPVLIGHDLYYEGGLRQNMPLAPAIRLGAERLLVATANHLPDPSLVPASVARERAATNPFFLLGKTLNALLLDRLDSDLQRLEQINAILAAGQTRFGDHFVRELNAALAPEHVHLKLTEAVVVRASLPVGVLAAEHVRAPEFGRGVRSPVRNALRALADTADGDLLSYLLFDGGYARKLIELGRRDARAHHEALCRLFAVGAERRRVAGGS